MTPPSGRSIHDPGKFRNEKILLLVSTFPRVVLSSGQFFPNTFMFIYQHAKDYSRDLGRRRVPDPQLLQILGKSAKVGKFTCHTQLDRSPSSGGVRSSYLDRFPNHLCFSFLFAENIFSSSQKFWGSVPSLLFTLITQNSENNAKIENFRADSVKKLKKKI